MARPVAVIDIGTSSVRMAVGEISPTGGVRTIETLTQAVGLGRDCFTVGVVSKSTIEECVRVLKSYRRVLDEYQIDQVRVVATSAVREAKNRMAFVDRVFIATGFEVEPIDEAEEARVTYLGVLPFLQSESSLAASDTIVIEIGGGSTELLFVRQANVVAAHSYRLGSLRMHHMLQTYQTPKREMRKIMENHISRSVKLIVEQVPIEGQCQIIALGGDVRFAAAHLLPDWNPTQLATIPLAALEQLTGEILDLRDDEIVARYHLTFPDADTLGPALLTYVQLARALNLPHLCVSNTNLRDGLLHEMASPASWTAEFSNQIIRSAFDLGRRYDFDEAHAVHVAQLSRSLFEQLRDEHQLGERFLMILQVAALLHEIGLYVSYQSHHKHSLYLIKNSDVFGMTRRDLLTAAFVARYYRRATPQPTHEGYSQLPREDRVVVAKLAAILRVAVALDDSRSQRIGRVECQREANRLVIRVPGISDLSLEQLALRQNASMFEDIYGIRILLRPALGATS